MVAMMSYRKIPKQNSAVILPYQNQPIYQKTMRKLPNSLDLLHQTIRTKQNVLQTEQERAI